MPDPPKFTFGGAPASGGSSGSLFGSAGAAPSGGLFGSSTGNSPASPAPSLFGQKPASGTENKPLFGGAPATSGSGFSFGGATSSTPTPATGGGLFGGGAASSTPAPAAGGGLFGGGGAAATSSNPAPATGGGLFGGGAASMSNPGSSSGFSFGNNANKDKGKEAENKPTTPGAGPVSGMNFGNLGTGTTTPAANKPSPLSFSTTPAGPPPTQPAGAFGGAAQPAGAPKSLFGNTAPTAPTTGLFGAKTNETNTAAAPSTGSLFSPKPAATSSAPSTGMFGSTGATPADGASSTPATNSLFTPKTADASNNQAPKLTFGAPATSTPATTSATQEAPKPAFTLGGAGAAGGAKPSFGALGGSSTPATTADAPKPAFSLGGANTSAPTSSTPSFSNLFGPKDDAAKPAASTAPSTGMFGNLGQKKDDATSAAPATSSAPAPSTGMFGNKATSSAATPSSTTATSGATPTTGMFGGSAAPKPADSSSKPADSTSTPAAGTTAPTSSTLGASTTGPAPPPTSRLASKSLDEILTLWTSSLTQHQKSFGNLATKISNWDRQLVENSDKISKLYSRTFQAERDTSEVERQLSAVEGQQKELEGWLDHYERVVDEMIARSGGAESGVDAERERTYRTAERATNRLTEISHDLTSMIEEINLASSSLTKSNKAANGTDSGAGGDPLAQIVRVLNSHLAQLQQIDSGAEQLQQRVAVAQKEARGLGGRGGLGGLGLQDDGVEGFMRSLRR